MEESTVGTIPLNSRVGWIWNATKHRHIVNEVIAVDNNREREREKKGGQFHEWRQHHMNLRA